MTFRWRGALKVSALAISVALLVTAGVGLYLRPDWRSLVGERVLLPIEGRFYDWRTGQRPTMKWADVERTFEALPKADAQEVASSSYSEYFGTYPAKSPYPAPTVFIRVDRANRFKFVFRNWRLIDFVCWDTRGRPFLWPQYIALDKKVLRKLQLLFDCLDGKRLDLWAIYIGDGFRTPRYNEAARWTRSAGRFSQHMYGTAVDLYLGDVNRDKNIDFADRTEIERCLDAIDASGRFRSLRGGRSNYAFANIVHFDCRGKAVRWK